MAGAVESFEEQRLQHLDLLALAAHARTFDEAAHFQDRICVALAKLDMALPVS